MQFRTDTLLLVLLLALSCSAVLAQGTAFTQQGRLTDNNVAANGAYDLQFALFDALNGGAQQGATLTRDDVPVTNGVFSVTLDFGATPFNGAARWLQISVRAGASTGAFTALNPRQPLSATPYAIRSASATSADNATQLGGVAASQYVQTADTRLSDDRNPTVGSANYVQNTTTPQAASNFNISGNGTAGGTLSGNVVNAATQFNLGGTRILSKVGLANLFAGELAGIGNTTGQQNAFFGHQAGQANQTGNFNAFSGQASGRDNTTGSGNSFFGSLAGLRNNAGSNNAFIGSVAGGFNTTGNDNAFVGSSAGQSNTTGNNNTLLGAAANVGVGNLSFATAIGSGSVVSTSNTIVLGRSSDTVNIPGGFSSAILGNAGNSNLFAGVGAGAGNTSGGFNSFFGARSGQNVSTGSGNVFIGNDTGLANVVGSSNTLLGSGANVLGTGFSFATAIGAGATVSSPNTIALGRSNGSDSVEVPGNLNAARSIFAIGGITSQGGISANGITSTGAITSTLVISANGGLTLNESLILLRGASDANHSIAYDSAIDGTRFTAFDRFRWVRGNGNIVQMTLQGNGNLELRGALLSVSDARYKTNVQTLPQALDQVLRLRGVSYQWKPEFNRDDRPQIGFIAQEVEAVLPALVSTDDQGFKSVAYANAVPVLVEALKEQQRRFAAENAALKAQLAALAERLTQLEQQAASRPR